MFLSYKWAVPVRLILYFLFSPLLIRNLLKSGKLDIVNQYLNRFWSVEGVVQRGRQLGKKIGFPTCNIDLSDYIIAKPGVYAVSVNINAVSYTHLTLPTKRIV